MSIKKRILAVALIVIVLSTLFYGCNNNYKEIEKKVRIILVGNLLLPNVDTTLKENLEKIINDKVNIDQILYTGKNARTQQEIAYQQKLLVIMAAGEGDLFILDKELFKAYASKGAFLPLDQLLEKYKYLNKYANNEFYIKAEDAKKKALYGLSAQSIKVLSDAGFDTKNKVIAIYVRTNKKERAIQALKSLLDSSVK
ncbi:hypothetical protein ACAG39_03270 [Caldicellulosiruptoraceae bacterium PP1]